MTQFECVYLPYFSTQLNLDLKTIKHNQVKTYLSYYFEN